MERISDLEKPRSVCAFSHHSRGGDILRWPWTSNAAPEVQYTREKPVHNIQPI